MEAHPPAQIPNQIGAAYGLTAGQVEELQGDLTAIVQGALARGLSASEVERRMGLWSAWFEREGWRRLRRKGLRPTARSRAACADLVRLLWSQSTREPGAGWRKVRSGASFAADHYVAVASLVAALGTALYTAAYARFYERFDLSPEQVGVTPAQILSHAAIGGVTLAVLIAFALFVALLPYIAVRDDPLAALEEGDWTDVGFNCVATAAGILGVIFAVGLVAGAPPSLTLTTSAIAVFMLLTSNLKLYERRRIGPRPLAFSWGKYGLGVALALVAGLIAAGAVTFGEAERLAGLAADGRAVEEPRIGGALPFLGVSAQPVLLSSNSPEPRPEVPGCALYLGRDGGRVVLYDPRNEITLQVPGRGLSLEFRSGQDSCEALRVSDRPRGAAG